jgi:mono/diheme cytochrome c family protein
MSITRQTLTATVAALVLAGCANTYDALDGYEQVEPAAAPDAPQAVASAYPAGQVERGRYLVGLLGCGSCHTDGALIGDPNAARLMAGSDVGIATSDPLAERHPGVVYPANLTPDQETGIGDWTLQQIVTMLQSGSDNHGSRSLPVMPFMTYSRLLPEDATAIAMYLKSLPAVQHRVPANVRPGQRATAPFVHFGIYRSQQ